MESVDSQKFPKIVELNVGGLHYTVACSTLTKFENTTLTTMFSGKWAVPCDKEGRYFIDRDGKMFRYILNYLRSPDKMGLPSDSGDLEQLKCEADYYQLKALEELIEKEQRGSGKYEYLVTSSPLFGSNSVNHKKYQQYLNTKAKIGWEYLETIYQNDFGQHGALVFRRKRIGDGKNGPPTDNSDSE